MKSLVLGIILACASASASTACDVATDLWEGTRELAAQECAADPTSTECAEARKLRQRAACQVYRHCGGEPAPAEKERCAKETPR